MVAARIAKMMLREGSWMIRSTCVREGGRSFIGQIAERCGKVGLRLADPVPLVQDCQPYDPRQDPHPSEVIHFKEGD